MNTIKEPKPNSKVWRYMNFERFNQLLSDKKLYFSRVDKLSDQSEGSITKNIIDDIYDRYENIQDFYMSPKEKDFRSVRDIQHMEKYKKYTLVNCWTHNNNESFALWKIYLGCQPFGVAIQTKYQKLKNSIIDEKYSYRFEKVYYSSKVKQEKVSSVHFRKNNYYKFENELRIAIFFQWKKFGGAPKFSKGTFVKVDLNELIEKVYVSPFAPEYFYEFVNYCIKEKYNYTFQVVRSKISER